MRDAIGGAARALVLAVASTCVLACRSTDARNPSAGGRSVESILQLVATSGTSFVFLQDDRMHVEDGPGMARHLRARAETRGSSEMTSDEFIRRCATTSDAQGSKYRVRAPDGSLVELADWLRARLAR